jgi:phosphatidate cytidylyltransferase
MRVDPDVRLILYGVCSTLLLASLIGFILQARVRQIAAIGIVENLNARIKAWWGIVLLGSAALFAGRTAMIALFATISFLALREFLTVTEVEAADHRAILACFLIVLPSQYLLVEAGWYDAFAIFIPAAGFLMLPILTALAGDTKNFLARTAELLWGLLVCVYGISHVPALLMLHIAGYEGRLPLLVVFLILVAQANDVLQYVWGKLVGKHKIAPGLSPSKTIEGFLGGAASATALGAGLWWMTPFSVIQAGAMAFAITLAGFLGGLVLSAVKRDRGIKDWSQLIPGHGGMLDRVDSICFSAPLFFHLTRIFFAS